MSNASEETAQGSVRLIFESDSNGVRLVMQQPVDVAVTGFDVHPDVRPGHYVEMRDAAGTPLSRVPVHAAFTGSTEVFPEDHTQPITRLDTAGQPETFSVVLPAPATSVQIAVVRIAATDPSTRIPGAGVTSPVPAEAAVTDLATFPIAPVK